MMIERKIRPTAVHDLALVGARHDVNSLGIGYSSVVDAGHIHPWTSASIPDL